MSPPPKRLSLLVTLNIVVGAVCLCGLGLLGLFLSFGVWHDVSTASTDDTIFGVIGVGFLAVPFLLCAPTCFLAAMGLKRRTSWGYGFHIAGSILAAFTCIGALYTLIGLGLALDSDFRTNYPPSSAEWTRSSEWT